MSMEDTAIPTATNVRPLIEAFDAVFSDLDGVVYKGAEAVQDAVETLNVVSDSGRPVVYITNNASRTPHAVSTQLRSLGLAAAVPENIVTSAQAIVPLIRERIGENGTVLVVGGEGLRAEIAAAGYTLVHEARGRIDAVAQGFAPDVCWTDLAEASYAIEAGAPWFASNQDWTLPKERGLAPGNGTLIAAVHTATGGFPTVAGKPEKPIFDLAVARFSAAQPLVIGDRLDTDIAGARNAGLHAALVLTGVDQAKQLLAAREEQRPDYIITTLADLLEPYEQVFVTAPGAASCGGSDCRIDGEALRYTGDPADVRTLRAAAASIWTSERPIDGIDVPAELYR